MIDHRTNLLEQLKNPKEAVEYYNVSYEIFNEDKDVDTFVAVFDDIIEAQNESGDIFLQLTFRILRMLVKLGDNRVDDAFMELKELQDLDLQSFIDMYLQSAPIAKLGEGHFTSV